MDDLEKRKTLLPLPGFEPWADFKFLKGGRKYCTIFYGVREEVSITVPL
jgi:hypothetical protein